jgi:hypothetical protein
VMYHHLLILRKAAYLNQGAAIAWISAKTLRLN